MKGNIIPTHVIGEDDQHVGASGRLGLARKGKKKRKHLDASQESFI
jgi:hypothetical protein